MLLQLVLTLILQTATAETILTSNGITEATCAERPASPQIPPALHNYLNGVIEITAGESKGSFWQAKQEGGEPAAIQCAGEDYILFDVYHADQSVSTIAVRDAEVFKDSIAHTPEEAEQLLNPAQPQSLTKGIDAAVSGAMDYVICTDSSQLNVRDESLNKILFQVARFASVKPVQSFGTDQMEKTIGGHTYTFTKIQVAANADQTGWIAEDYLKLRSQCPGAEVKEPDYRTGTWTFPTNKRATTSYKSGMRKFKAGRSGGRLHAACDIYRVKGEPAVAVNSGTVIRDRYYFYQGTYALEIKHSDGKVVRYGEITGTAASNIAAGKTVATGQTVGYIGKVNSNCCEPMLHFEMYTGTATGSLSQSGNAFQRRKDLMDPSNLLTEWEKTKFGTAY